MSKRTKAILGGVATVVVLAAVILGLSAISASKKSAVTPPTIQYSASQQSQQAYAAGQSALASGDTTAAIADFKRAVALDPSNTAAQTSLTETTDSQTNTSSNSSSSSKSSTTKKTSTSPSSNTTSPTDWSTQPLADLKVLLPAKFSGYVMGQRIVIGPDAVISATAANSKSQASHVEWTVHDRTSVTGANTYMTKVTKTVYPKDSSSVTINGVSGSFGTDGDQFAAVVYRKGRYVFEVVLTAPSGSPGDLKQLATQAAASFPTAP